jgi:hypothetical protein
MEVRVYWTIHTRSVCSETQHRISMYANTPTASPRPCSSGAELEAAGPRPQTCGHANELSRSRLQVHQGCHTKPTTVIGYLLDCLRCLEMDYTILTPASPSPVAVRSTCLNRSSSLLFVFFDALTLQRILLEYPSRVVSLHGSILQLASFQPTTCPHKPLFA